VQGDQGATPVYCRRFSQFRRVICQKLGRPVVFADFFLNKLGGNMQTLTLGVFSQLYQLRLNGQNLFILDIRTLTSIDVKLLYGLHSCTPSNLNSRPVAHNSGKPKIVQDGY
jgi:hypothetical protein